MNPSKKRATSSDKFSTKASLHAGCGAVGSRFHKEAAADKALVDSAPSVTSATASGSPCWVGALLATSSIRDDMLDRMTNLSMLMKPMAR